MSSISNERKADETVRRANDEANRREVENGKKHAAEMRRMTEKFNAEIEQLKASHQAQIEEYRNRSGSSLNERDQNYQAQMAKMREVFNEQMRKKSEDFEQIRTSMAEAQRADQEKLKSINEQQREIMTKEFKNTLENKDRAFEEYAKTTKANADEQWAARRDKVDSKRAEERIEANRGFEQKIGQLQTQLRDVRSQKDNELKRVKSAHAIEKEVISDNYITQLQKERENNQVSRESMSDLFKSKQMSDKEKYRQALQDNQRTSAKFNEEFRRDIQDRIGNRVTSLESNIKQQKDLNVVDAVNRKRIAANELKAVVQESQGRIRQHEEAKNLAIARSNEAIAGEVNRAVKLKDEVIREQNIDHAESRDKVKTDHQRQLFQIQHDHEAQVGHTKLRADTLLEKTLENSRKVAVKQEEFYKESLAQLKESYSEELNSERQRNVRERAELESRVEKRAKENELALQKQLDKKDQEFAGKLETMKEAFEKENRRQQEEFKQRFGAQEKSHRMAIETERMKAEGMTTQMRDVHEKEIERVEKAHRQELRDLAQKMNYINKKG